jgi:uncharacterized membrane protein YphA (DoxX/SURF4 family)
MDFRNKWLVRVVRILLGAFFIFSGVGGFMAAFNGWQGVPAETLTNTQALWDTGIFHLVKGMEIVAGLMLVFSFFPWLAVIFLAPIGIGAIVVNLRTAPEYIWAALVCTLLLVYLAYVYWNKYAALFQK